MKLFRQFLPIIYFALLIFSSCKKDEPLTSSTAKLEFSTDSILFDTVFRYAGSTTQVFKIINRHHQKMNISKAYLGSGTSSAYKINIDGISTTPSAPVIRDIEILADDSLFVFVQVHVNPSQNAPLLIKDSVIFEINGNIQDVKLTAIGQDVYLHKPLPGKFYSIISGFNSPDTTLPNDKPHLFFGYVVVDSARIVRIQEGTHIYLHNHAVLWVYKDGTLIVKGIHGNEVTFQGDRLEAGYKELPGQWGKIWLSAGSKNNEIDWAIIKNGGIGVQADTVVTPGVPNLKISNTIIKNMQAAAIYGQGSHIWANNCVFANCGQYVAALTIGGKYKFEQCTFANYWNQEQRTTPIIALNNYYVSGGSLYVIRDLDSAYFGNCIIYGDIADEVGLDSSTYGGIFNYKFDHCFVKTGLNTANGLHYDSVYPNTDPVFKDASINDYQLTQGSPAIDKGTTNIIISEDLNGKPRPNPNTSIPDLGAYEFQ